MEHPVSRILALLELLQARPGLTGAEIAERLDVDVRTVRRYAARLAELGIPVRAERGRYGGYRLLPGYRLPPLMLTGDEAASVVLGLLAGRRSGLSVGSRPGSRPSPRSSGCCRRRCATRSRPSSRPSD